eukprot:m.32553 g.32553  ORF g.32553 m.32553 type:complete len:134 (+) comp9401_c0_seq2:288-689(+)
MADRSGVYVRALAVWAGLMVAESVHGVLRVFYLSPRVGDFRARQLAVFSGSALIFGLTRATDRFVGAGSDATLLRVGAQWVVCTIAFELFLGRVVANARWERILEDYNVLRGGLMPLGLASMLFTPLAVARLR